MASFKKFRDQINQQFKMLSKQELFTVDVDKDISEIEEMLKAL